VTRYVALGDSYTIGTAIDPAESWPSQLVARVAGLELVANLAVNGIDTGDLIAFELPGLEALAPEFVTLQVGVNDVVRDASEASYAANLDRIFSELLSALAPDRIVAVATPDYTVSPMGRAFGDPAMRRATIERFNEILGGSAEARDVAFVAEPFSISQAAANDRALLANDGLHPSAAQYALWVDAIEPVVRARLAATV
jgi:lysophospholipase L1-like esterase